MREWRFELQRAVRCMGRGKGSEGRIDVAGALWPKAQGTENKK